MTDKEMHPLTVSQCISSDWCRGYNEAVKEANEIVGNLEAEIERWKNKAICYQGLWCEGMTDLQTAKSEAYKEFADLFKQEMRNCANAEFDGIKYYLIGEEFVNRRVKELTEGSK